MKSINGNIIKNDIKIIAWNKGNASALNKKIEIDLILDTEKPEILFITECIFYYNEDINSIKHVNYNVELDKMYETNGICRTVAFIKKQHCLY